MRELHQDSGSRSAAGVAAYPTRPPTPAGPRSDPPGDASGRVVASKTWWLVHNGNDVASPVLAADLDCEVAVIGAGIAGALIAHGLAEDGHEIVVLDRRDRALGGTAASTALIQYEIDTMLGQLMRAVGPVRARLAYQASVDAIGLLDQLDERLGRCVDFSRCESVYLASRRRDQPGLLHELRLRQDSGIHVDFLRRADLMLRYGARRRCALYSADAATVDPVRLARRLLDDAREQHGMRAFSQALVQRLEPRPDHVVLHLADGHRVRACHAIVCAGHESLPLLPARLATLHTTFAAITSPVIRSMPRRSRAVFWETARPYLYVRETDDGRVLVGGQDVPYRRAEVRNGLIRRQARRLMRRYERLFGERLKPAHAWAGHYAATTDGLPFIGSWPDGPDRVLFALCFGGNGIVHAVQAREMMRARLHGDRHHLDDVYGFERLSRRNIFPSRR